MVSIHFEAGRIEHAFLIEHGAIELCLLIEVILDFCVEFHISYYVDH